MRDLKPGDLVKLTNRGLEPAAVAVAVTWSAFDSALGEQVFEAGAPCIFLGDTSSPNDEYTVSSVLIDGRVGWVWPYELEPL